MPPERQIKVVISYGTRNKKEVKESQKDITKLGKSVENVSKVTEKGFQKMGRNLTFLAWHFRYLGAIFDRIGQQMIRVVKDVIKTSAELQESFLSIEVAAAMYGQSAERARKFSKDLALRGLMPLVESANAVKNLMITGIGLPELEDFTYRYLDVAFLFTSGADEMSKSLETMSQSILRGTLVLSKDVTARTLWMETEKRLQKTMGITMKELSAQRRALELLITMETKYIATQGLHQMETETTRAAMTRLNASITLIKEAFGTALLPMLNAVASSMRTISEVITDLIERLGSTISVITGVAIAVTFLIAKFSFAIGIVLSFIKIANAGSLVLWKLYVPILAVSALITAGIYLWLRYTGALDKAQGSAKAITNQISKLREEFAGAMAMQEDTIDIDEDRRIKHERVVEDIMEDLEKERSKGLWANQMSIKDLEKRLKRENEDWAKYEKKRGQTAEKGTKNIFETLDDLEKNTEEKVGIMKVLWEDLVNGIRKLFDKLSSYVTGILAAISTYALFRFLPILVSVFEIIYLKALYAFGAIKAMILSLGIVVSAWTWAPLLGAAAVGAAVALQVEFSRLKKDLDALNDAMELGGEISGKYLQHLKDLREEGKITAREYRERLEAESRRRREAAGYAEEVVGGLGWQELLFGRRIFQTGGIVPGMRNQAVPIMAHGGERVIPAGETAGGGITININNPVVREQEDINRIAQAVSRVLGQRTRWGKMGAL